MDKMFGEILSMSVDSAWLIVAVIIVRAILQKAPMYFRKILWGLVGLRLLIPFSFESSLSLVPHEVQQTTDNVVAQVVAAPVKQELSFSEIVPFLWVAVCVTLLIYGIISYIKVKLKIIDSILVKDNIYYSDRIDSPFVCGFIKPKIYLPYGLDEATQKCVLQHEKTHIKSADHIIKVFSFLILCVHWYNPLVWVAYFMLCKDIELSCDESVIKRYDADECKQYTKALLKLGVNKAKFTACPVAFGEVSIKTRIKGVINYKKASKILVLASICLCIGVSLCFMTEPEVALKAGNEKIENPEETIEPVQETVTEPIIESSVESTAEPITEVVADDPVQSETEKNVVVNDVETTAPLLVFEAPTFRNLFETNYYVEHDPMREEAEDAGVFANKEEKDSLIVVLENSN